MVALQGGEFWMGSDASDSDAESNEKPRHRVRVAPFRMGKYEVTRGEYAAFVADSGYRGDDSCFEWDVSTLRQLEPLVASWSTPGFTQNDREPVICVTLQDAELSILWLQRRTGRRYRLPTETEWEYAARGGTTTIRPWGDEAAGACQYANGPDLTAQEKFSSWLVPPASE